MLQDKIVEVNMMKSEVPRIFLIKFTFLGCECDVLGTNGTVQFCDRYTGQCPCLKNVIGTRCDECIENHWKIASGQGCEACDCDRVGSNSEQCNPYDGQCDCTQGFGGRACDQCETNFWGDPNVECKGKNVI